MKYYGKHSETITIGKEYKNHMHPVIIRVTFCGERIELYTGISVPKLKWDSKRHCVKQGATINNSTYDILNDSIGRYEQFVRDYFAEHNLREQPPSLSELKELFNNTCKLSGTKKAEEFFHVLHNYIYELNKNWTDANKEKFNRLSNHLKEHRPKLKFVDFSEQFMVDFVTYLSKTKNNDTISKELSTLKQFLTWAKGKKYPVNDEFFTFKFTFSKKQTDVRFLEKEELQRIIDLEYEEGSAMDITRDLFVFQCFTALRYSDIKNLKHENITYNAQEGVYMIKLMTQKDKGRIDFKLAPAAESIYLKHKDKSIDDKVFCVISNQKYNEHLKDLGKDAKLEGEWVDIHFKLGERIETRTPKSDLASHTARRTFISLALNNGVPLDKVAMITSHSEIKAMQPYLKLTSKGKEEVIDVVGGLFK